MERLETLYSIGNGIIVCPFLDKEVEGVICNELHLNISNNLNWQTEDLSTSYLDFDIYIENPKRYTSQSNYRNPSIFFGLPEYIINIECSVYDLVDELENDKSLTPSLYKLPIIRSDLLYLSKPKEWEKLLMVKWRTSYAVLIKCKNSELSFLLIATTRFGPRDIVTYKYT
jgi:hypothetical protein